MADEWCMQVWDWNKCKITSKSEPYNSIELACTFHPSKNDVVYTCGDKHVFFWNEHGDTLEKEEGHFYDYEAAEYVTCLAFSSDEELITADSEGYLHLWDMDDQITKSVIKSVHSGSIMTVLVLPGDKIITGGASDRLLTLIDPDQMVPTINQVQLPDTVGGAVAIAPMKSGFAGTDFGVLRLIVGTTLNCILSGTMSTSFLKLVSGPTEKMKALAMHPSDTKFITAGFDKSVTLWDASEHVEVWSKKMTHSCSAAAFYPDTGEIGTEIVAIGTSAGRWMVLNAQDSNHLASFQSDQSEITCMSFSPDGNSLAVGTASGTIYMYRVYDDGKTYRFSEAIRVSTILMVLEFRLVVLSLTYPLHTLFFENF